MHYSKAKTKEIIFPLGGIGTGCIGLCGNGRFQDWEIFNRPNKGTFNGCSHIAVKAEHDGKSVVKVLNGDLETGLMGFYQRRRFCGFGYGPEGGTMAGFSHFRNHSFDSEFPFAKIHMSDPDFPCRMTLEAFNPFIPGCSKDSSLPCAFLTVTFENTTDSPLDVTAALSVTNPYEKTRNVHKKLKDAESVILYSDGEKGTIKEGNITIVSVGDMAGAQEYWYRGSWKDPIATFWRQLEDGSLPERHYEDSGKSDTATVWAKATVEAHKKTSLRFLLTWFNPICENYWDRTAKDENGNNLLWKNWYSTQFSSSAEVARYCLYHFSSLRKRSMDFVRAFRKSTLPQEVLEAATANLCVLKTPTVYRLEDGTLWGWEGVNETEGSCQGTCTHVWNYAYALCFLFPDLERSIRTSDYLYNQHPSGLMRFRIPIPPTSIRDAEMACVDGQMGGILRAYREWKLSGDTEWLRSLWPRIKKSLEFAVSPENRFRWDYNGDGILEGRQHHTLDMELFGPSSWLEGFYIAALKAAAVMARALDDQKIAEKWEKMAANGSRFTEEELFNGNYYIQKVDLKNKETLTPFGEDVVSTYWNSEANEIKYQIAEGSEIDQLCAQWHANIIGLGDIFEKDHRRKALDYLYHHNFKKSVRYLCNTWRNFIVNDEAGAVICVYDDAEKPRIPIPYTEECMTGFEYQLAGLLMSEGNIDRGLEIVRGIRGRYDGEKRNPFNEMECGSNYARSMASYAMIPILSGFTFDYTKHAIGFNPLLNGERFSAPFGIGNAFGIIEIDESQAKITILSGTLLLSELSLPQQKRPCRKVIGDGETVLFKEVQGKIQFIGTPLAIQHSLCLCRS